jgi:hypothetical protein
MFLLSPPSSWKVELDCSDNLIIFWAIYFQTEVEVPKPDPELLPIQRPRCPKCEIRMVTIWASQTADGIEQRTFECLKCHHLEIRPMVTARSRSSDASAGIQG